MISCGFSFEFGVFELILGFYLLFTVLVVPFLCIGGCLGLGWFTWVICCLVFDLGWFVGVALALCFVGLVV